MSDWLIYGATGYTGRLITAEAVSRGLKPILAGRNEASVRSLASEFQLPYRVFSVESSELQGVSLILNCAGPFSHTATPLVEACLSQKIDYLDITGEIDVLESVHSRGVDARRIGAVLMPGVGFDVVPSDCLAAHLKARLPDATELELAFTMVGGTVSPGTLKSMLENVPRGTRVRRNGLIVTKPLGSLSRKVPFPAGSVWTGAIAWGDVSTAYYSTGIGNITVYSAVSKAFIAATRILQPLTPLVRVPTIQNFLNRQIEKRVKGPSELQRKRAKTYLWGKVTNQQGKTVEGSLEVPEGYHLTALTAVRCAELVMEKKLEGGAYTPSMAFGADFILSFPGTKMKIGS